MHWPFSPSLHSPEPVLCPVYANPLLEPPAEIDQYPSVKPSGRASTIAAAVQVVFQCRAASHRKLD